MRSRGVGRMRFWAVIPLVSGSLVLAACGSSASSLPISRGSQLTAKACRDIDSVMTPKHGTVITWDSTDLSRSPFQALVAVVYNSPNVTLHSELAAFESAARSGDVSGVFNDSNALLKTCRKLGFGT
jgi:hypothetical protein